MISWLDSLLKLANEFEGIATWILAVMAVLTGFIAIATLLYTRALRFEQARPYVVIGLRRVTPTAVELYVKNYGTTAAHAITIESNPPLRSLTFAERFHPPVHIALLAPGADWSTIWETKAAARKTLPSKANWYDITIRYEARVTRRCGRKPLSVPIEDKMPLDWTPYLGTTFADDRPLHQIAKALESGSDRLAPLELLAQRTADTLYGRAGLSSYLDRARRVLRRAKR